MIQSSTYCKQDHNFDLFAILRHFPTGAVNRNTQVASINKGRDTYLLITLETFAGIHMKVQKIFKDIKKPLMVDSTNK